MTRTLDPQQEAEEKALVRGAQEGDDSAFGELVRMHQDRLYGFALRFLRDKHEAQDAVQETFLAFHRSLAKYQPLRPLSVWLFTVCANLCRSRLRRRKIVKFLTFSDLSQNEESLPPDWAAEKPDPGQAAESEESVRRLHRLILGLPEKLRMPLVLRHFHGASDEDVASILGISISNVRVRMHRAKEQLWNSFTEVSP